MVNRDDYPVDFGCMLALLDLNPITGSKWMSSHARHATDLNLCEL